MSELRDKIINLKNHMEERIVGQEDLVKKLLITMLAGGHALVEGAPGLVLKFSFRFLRPAGQF